MRRRLMTDSMAVLAAGAMLALPVAAADEPPPETPVAADAATPPASAASAVAAEQPASAPPKPRRDIEGAIGPMFSYDPQYQGAAGSRLKWTPGIFIRWGRYTITNAGGFVTRRDDDVMRGLAADFVRSDRTRVNLALRVDRGRQSSDSAALTGLPDIRPTIRARLIGTRNFDDGISATAGVNVDLLARGGGTVYDLSVAKSFALALRTTWSISAGLTAADQRYMRSYFGITPQQSAITGYPEYEPGSGLRDLSFGTALRTQYSERWVGYLGAGTSRLLGPAAASPLSKRLWGWGLNGGIAWRF